ncbi:tyrosine--tRNA ligase [Marinomonas agarivorans]|nr:tyrosine--tRNA ligase [Marinomonas agarivorans]
MAITSNDLLKDLSARGLIAQTTAEAELAEHLNQKARTLYCGFDPTADSLHIGSLVPLLMLKRFQDAGHKPLALVGGATGLIGDPSFKAVERKLNGPEVVSEWVEKLRAQVSQFITFNGEANSAEVVNNYDWTKNLNVIDFLRDVGKHFSINSMIQKESVKQRINREGEGISFTEFTYMILQSYDFAELNRLYSCTLQVGGSDQWGNITGGTDLTRRQNGNQVFGLTMPLVTKADGTKFGKTETGTIWLDKNKTSQYAFYQFWLGTADADVYKFLKYFTFLSVEDIDAIEKQDKESGVKPEAQSILAAEVTKLVHGEEGLVAAKRITAALFNNELVDLSEQDFSQLQLDGLPSSTVSKNDLAGGSLTSFLVDARLAASGKQVKDALQRNSVFVNNVAKGIEDNMKLAEIFDSVNGYYSKYFLVKLGKKKHHLFVLED